MSNTMARHSLQRKVSLRLSLAMALFVSIVFWILLSVITPAFEDLRDRLRIGGLLFQGFSHRTVQLVPAILIEIFIE